MIVTPQIFVSLDMGRMAGLIETLPRKAYKAAISKFVESGLQLRQLCRREGISLSTPYGLRNKY